MRQVGGHVTQAVISNTPATGTIAVPFTFIGSTSIADTWAWTFLSVPAGSAFTAGPTPYPDNGATAPIDMTDNEGLWHLEDNFLDTSGNGIDGQQNQPTLVAGKVGTYAYQFRQRDRLEFGDNFQFSTSDFSVSFWIKPGATQVAGAVVMSHLAFSPYDGWTFEQNGGSLNQYCLRSTSANSITSTPSIAITAGVWQHIALVRAGTNVKIYRDGVLVINSTQAGFGSIGNRVCTFSMGNHSDQTGSTQWWNGELDEVAIFSRAISGVEALDIYNQQVGGGNPFPDNGGPGWFNMANNEGLYHFENNYLDSSGNGRDGALYGPFSTPICQVGTGSYAFESQYGWVYTTSDFGFATAPFSVSLWVYPYSTQPGNAFLLGLHSNPTYQGWFLYQPTANTNQFRFASYLNGTLTQGSLFSLTANAWNNVLLVRSGTNVKVYVNGALATNDTNAAFANIGTTNRPLMLGSIDPVVRAEFNLNTTHYLLGRLDEVSIWSRDLSAADALAIYTEQSTNGTPFPDNSSPSGWFDMTDNEALWHLSGDLLDYSGNDRHGSRSGLAVGARKLGSYGYSFSGYGIVQTNQSFVEFGSSYNFPASDFSFAFWVNPDSTQASYALLLSNITASPYNGWYFQQDAGSTNNFWFVAASASTFTISPVIVLPALTWSFVAVVRSGTNVKIYLNGVLAVDSTQAGFGAIGATTSPLTLGAHPLVTGITTVNFRGYMDEVAIWSRALSASEITDIYNLQDAGIYSTAQDFTFTPDVNGVYTVQLSVTGYDFGNLVTDSTTGVLTLGAPPAAGIRTLPRGRGPMTGPAWSIT